MSGNETDFDRKEIVKSNTDGLGRLAKHCRFGYPAPVQVTKLDASLMHLALEWILLAMCNFKMR